MGQTRVHCDEVEGLGCFMELEVCFIKLHLAEGSNYPEEELKSRGRNHLILLLFHLFFAQISLWFECDFQFI